MKDKFIVKILLEPDNEKSEYKELRFKSRKEISEFLNIPMTNIITMINHNFKCLHPKHKHLKGITIERIENTNSEKPVQIDAEEFRRKILEKIA
jgi:hypothetical protein